MSAITLKLPAIFLPSSAITPRLPAFFLHLPAVTRRGEAGSGRRLARDEDLVPALARSATSHEAQGRPPAPSAAENETRTLVCPQRRRRRSASAASPSTGTSALSPTPWPGAGPRRSCCCRCRGASTRKDGRYFLQPQEPRSRLRLLRAADVCADLRPHPSAGRGGRSDRLAPRDGADAEQRRVPAGVLRLLRAPRLFSSQSLFCGRAAEAQQGQVAAACGWRVPRMFVTNSLGEALAASPAAEELIMKPPRFNPET